MKLANAIWESEWWKAPSDIKRDLKFVIRRCQKPFLVKGLFFEITLDTFTNVRSSLKVNIHVLLLFSLFFKIMNAAGSYVALLMNFLD
jgi:hypothetical protein